MDFLNGKNIEFLALNASQSDIVISIICPQTNASIRFTSPDFLRLNHDGFPRLRYRRQESTAGFLVVLGEAKVWSVFGF